MKKGNCIAIAILASGLVLTGIGFYLEDKNKPKKTDDIMDLSRIYSTDPNGFNYSLPKKVLEGFLSGVAFDNKTAYTPEEQEKLAKDINEIWANIVGSNPSKEKIAVITAGAPGAGKTTVMEQTLTAEMAKGNRFAYIDPDAVGLKKMTHTYQQQLSDEVAKDSSKPISDDDLKKIREDAYTKWRPASNGFTHLALGNAIKEGYGIFFGTASSSPLTADCYKYFKTQGYEIHVIHVTASDETRWESIKARDKLFVQTTAQDIREKGLLVPQRISDTFLKHADTIAFHFRDKADENAVLAATWIRNPNNPDIGTLKINNLKAYSKLIAIHDAAIHQLKKPELSWQMTVGAKSIEACPTGVCK